MYRYLPTPAIFVIVMCTLGLCSAPATADAEVRKAVLVTGASTGIGRKITEVLAEKCDFVSRMNETADSGVLAILIEPGAFKSEIWIRDILHSMGKNPDNPGDLTAEEQAQIDKAMSDYAKPQEPDAVAEAVAHALFSGKPRPRYMVPSSQQQAQIVTWTLLTKVARIKTGQPYSYSLEDLQAMLAEAMAAQ